MNLEKTRAMLWSVSDSYDDFVEGMIICHKKDLHQIQSLEQFIIDHPEARTDDIIEYMDQFLDLYDFEKEGYPEPLPTATATVSALA